MSKRKEATDWLLSEIDNLQKGTPNVKILRDYLNGLSEKDHKALCEKLATGTEILPFYNPNLKGKEKSLNVTNMLSMCDRLGISVFQQLILTDRITGVKFKTTHKYMVLLLSSRRQIQTVMKGKSVAEDNRHTDTFTGQASSKSAVVKITYPEMLILDAMGHKNAVLELLGARGGNEAAFKLMKRNLLNTGEVSMAELEELGTRATSLETARAYLFAMHLENNL